MARLEAWAQRAWDWSDVADHTYVKCIDNGQFFDCWADNHEGPDQRFISAGYGSYSVANCYRYPVLGFRDTAGIGIYAVDGVCHQATNCFLYPANVTLNFNVRGYWFSAFTYGTYGRSFWRWLGMYSWCYWNNPRTVAEREEAAAQAADDETVPDKLRKLHAAHLSRREPVHPHDRLMDEVAEVTKHHSPKIDTKKFRGLHGDFLKEKDGVVASGMKGRALADKLNDLSAQAQKELAKTLTDEEYESLMGTKPGDPIYLIEPGAADIAGQPVPIDDHKLAPKP